MKLKKPNETFADIVITIRGGVAGVLYKNRAASLEIQDYDTDGEESLHTSKDSDGDLYVWSFWDRDEEQR